MVLTALLKLVQAKHFVGAPLAVVAVIVAVTQVLIVNTPFHPQLV